MTPETDNLTSHDPDCNSIVGGECNCGGYERIGTITYCDNPLVQPGDHIKITYCDDRWWRRLLYFIFTLGTKRPMRHEYHMVSEVLMHGYDLPEGGRFDSTRDRR